MWRLPVPEDTIQRTAEKKTEAGRKIIGRLLQSQSDHPYFYRNKVHAVFDHDRKGNVISGIYAEGTHRVIAVEECLIEDKKSQEIIRTIRELLPSFKIKTYNEDTGYGLLRHVLVRRGLRLVRLWSFWCWGRQFFHQRITL